MTFADGSEANLVYPKRLALHELGVQPTVSLALKTEGDQNHERFLLMTRSPISRFSDDPQPRRTFAGTPGSTELWRNTEKGSLYPLYLVFQFEDWHLLVGDGNVGNFMSARNRRLWAENLHAQVNEEGFIVVEPRRPLVFADSPSGGSGVLFSGCATFVDLRHGRCVDVADTGPAKNARVVEIGGVAIQRYKQGGRAHANWCLPDEMISIYLDSWDQDWIDLAVRGLRISTEPAG